MKNYYKIINESQILFSDEKFDNTWSEFDTENIDSELSEKITKIENINIKINKISEAHQLLKKTDYKFLKGYKPKEDEDLLEIEKARDEAREFIRANEGDE